MWHFRTWFSRHSSVGVMVGLDDLRGLFQPMIPFMLSHSAKVTTVQARLMKTRANSGVSSSTAPKILLRAQMDGPCSLYWLSQGHCAWSFSLVCQKNCNCACHLQHFFSDGSHVFINFSKWVYKLDLSTHKSLCPPPKYSHLWDDAQQLL